MSVEGVPLPPIYATYTYYYYSLSTRGESTTT